MNRIFLIGGMGAGKSTVGQCLATLCGWPYVDSDQVIEQATARPVAELFAHEGEARFREREQATIQQLLQHAPLVLATGGGAVLSPLTRDRLRTQGIVVWLQVSLDIQQQRLQHPPIRPLYRDATQLAALQAARAPLYAAIADLCLNTDHATPLALAQHIWQFVQCYTKP